MQPWVVKGDADPIAGVPLTVTTDDTLTWQRRANTTLTVWFTGPDNARSPITVLPDRPNALARATTPLALHRDGQFLR